MSAVEPGPSILVLAPPGGGGPLVTRGLSGHRTLAAFGDGRLILSLLQAADGTLESLVVPEGDSVFEPDEVAAAVSAVLDEAASRRHELAVQTVRQNLQARLAGSRRPYALHAVGCAARVDMLAALFPEATIVHVVRDPRAFVLQRAREEVVPRGAAGLASDWLRETAALLLFGLANPGRVVRLPYEALLSEVQVTCERLCRALGVSSEPQAMAESLRDGLREDEELVFQRGALDPAELTELERALQPLLALLGFRPAAFSPFPEDERDDSGRSGTRRMSLADEVAHLREERDRFADELQELRRRLDDDQQLPADVEVLRRKAKRYDQMRAAAKPGRLFKRLRDRRRR